LSKEKTTREWGRREEKKRSRWLKTHANVKHTPTPTGTKKNGCRCRIPDKAEKSKEMGTKTVTTVTLDFEGQYPRKKQTNKYLH